MVRTLGHAMLYDVSLFERLYTGPNMPGLARTMLDVSGCPSGDIKTLFT